VGIVSDEEKKLVGGPVVGYLAAVAALIILLIA
jgi:hypothetical protein